MRGGLLSLVTSNVSFYLSLCSRNIVIYIHCSLIVGLTVYSEYITLLILPLVPPQHPCTAGESAPCIHVHVAFVL